ncbi:hypothetical protein AAVH_28124 [Aphelenchoides avenae]|nr:hypothetical protein AAVH_28124 [Aphelenchus avenae]
MTLKIRSLYGAVYDARTVHEITKAKLEDTKNRKKELCDELGQLKQNRSSKTKLLKDEIKSLKKQLHECKSSSAKRSKGGEC